MPDPDKSTLKGHGLLYEGAPFKVKGCAQCGPLMFFMRTGIGVGGDGHGKCSCGAASDHLPSGAARKRWHKTHKQEIRGGEEK